MTNAMISTIYFDLGGVVFDFRPDKRLQKMATISGISEETLQAELFDSGFSDDCDAGVYSAQAMYLSACNRLSWTPSYQEFQHLWVGAFVPDVSVIALARILSASYKVGLLTNNPPILREVLTEIHADMERIFNPILFSGELRMMKPDVAIFHKAVEMAKCPADEILFIDDSTKHIQGAQQVGMKAIHFATTSSLVEELQRIGIELLNT